MTKEERYILKLFELAPDSPINREDVGEAIGLSPKPVSNICNQLAQANFIKKVSKEEIQITPLGIALAQSLL